MTKQTKKISNAVNQKMANEITNNKGTSETIKLATNFTILNTDILLFADLSNTKSTSSF